MRTPLLASLSLLFLLSSIACSKPTAEKVAKPVEKSAPLAVQTVAVESRAIPRFLTLTGGLQADRQSEIAANVGGRVVNTYVERGQRVKAGQPIAVVDSKASSLTAQAADAQLRAAETQTTQAQTECERADTLFKQGATTKAEYDRAKASCQAQIFAAEAARANAGLAAKVAGDAVIRAPFDGVIGERYINVGEYVQPPTRVASLYTVNPIRVAISVPESAVGQVSPDQPIEVKVSAFADRVFAGKVKYIAPALRAQTRDLLIEAVVENPDGALKSGMFATVRLLVGEEQQPTVPQEALRSDGSVQRLFLARNNKAVEMVVRTGGSKDGHVAVLESLTAQDQVIVRPPASLRDGAALQ